MENYYHVIPVNRGLFVPAKNMGDLIADINNLYEDNPDVNFYLDPTDWVKAMDRLRDNGFFIHQKAPTHGVTLAGWGTNGNPYDGHPKNKLQVGEFHPINIVNLFQEYSSGKSNAGVLTINDYGEENIYYDGYPNELIWDEESTLKVNRSISVKDFYDPNDMTCGVQVIQYVSPNGNQFDRYPVRILKTNDYKEILNFCRYCVQEYGAVLEGAG